MAESVVVSGLTRTFRSRFGGDAIVAVDDVSFSVDRGEIFGVVGESGSGKTTVARMILGLVEPTSGSIRVEGVDVWSGSRADRKRLPQLLQVVFQDPYSSMNPRHRIGKIVTEGLRKMPKAEREREAARHLEMVGLSAMVAGSYPRELSGGQRQRVAVARALTMSPSVLVADEPVSALDVSIQGQILNLLAELRSEFGLTILFISHDLGVVRQLCDNVVVMSKGCIVEQGESDSVFERPEHPYTKRLIASIARVPESES